MKQTLRDWLLDREKDAVARLDALRRGVVAAERATFPESVAEIFRPNLRAWASLALLWVVLAAAQARLGSDPAAASRAALRAPDLASLDLATNEKISLLDARF